MKNVLLLFLCVLVSACATAPPTPRPDGFFNDSLFSPAQEPINSDDVFALSDEMREFLKTRIADQMRIKGPHQALFDALYDKNQLRLEYDATFTRNAAQAFAARTGNCLSLVIMTGAFAHALGLEVVYQKVLGKESWSRGEGLLFANEHVNLGLRGRRVMPPVSRDTRVEINYMTTIDFGPPEPMPSQRIRTISQRTVVAMFMNNRAGESLASGRLDDAYWWARASTIEDPKLIEAYNTLSVVYRRRGNLEEAKRVLEYIVQLEPANLPAMSNLSITLGDLGQVAEAQALNQKIQQLRAFPPFYFFDQGVAAMQEGKFSAAKDLFTREIDRDRYYHEFHAWLAAAYLALGDASQGRRHMMLAIENSPTQRERELYAAKLDGIDSRTMH